MKSIKDIDRCAICLDEKCGGTHKCNCDNCCHLYECYKFLHATIRITNKCTQKCDHCCFSSSPNSSIMMTVDNAKKIGRFLINNEVTNINIMGGEFFCNPNWYEILDILASSVSFIRLVSNGDWVIYTNEKDKLAEFVGKHKDKLRISISNDKWHNNNNISKAEEWLKSVNVTYNIGDDSNMPDNGIVPIGRGMLHYSIYSSLGCYCHNPVNNYSFLIDEVGNIYKCSFGVWNYANINDYIDGGFCKRFKEFNKKFYDIFIPSCSACLKSACKEDDNIVKMK